MAIVETLANTIHQNSGATDRPISTLKRIPTYICSANLVTSSPDLAVLVVGHKRPNKTETRATRDAWWIMRTRYLVGEMVRSGDKTRTCGLEILTIKAHLSQVLWKWWQNNREKWNTFKVGWTVTAQILHNGPKNLWWLLSCSHFMHNLIHSFNKFL